MCNRCCVPTMHLLRFVIACYISLNVSFSFTLVRRVKQGKEMQVISDLQQRPNKGRLTIEKSIVSFYDLCTLTQIVTCIIHAVQTRVCAARTFQNNFFASSTFELAPSIVYKTANCTFNATRDIYAFNQVEMTFNASSINDVFVDQAVQMRLSIFIMIVALFLGIVNHSCVENNFFVIEIRNFTFYKDLLSSTEIILLCYVMQIAAASHPPALLLRDYLSYCGITKHVFLPYLGNATMYVFAAVGFTSYLVGLFFYLWNSLPKYGVMSPAEIEEYKAWLRQRKAEMEQSRVFIEQAKRLHAQIQLMQTADFSMGRGKDGAREQVPIVPPPPVYPSTAYAPPNYPYANPALPPGMVYPPVNPNMPAPQLFGVGAPSAFLPPGYTPATYMQGSAAHASGTSMPRKRNVPNM
ncbi:hypothetical protein STCU_01363 [Strigomonas culicis]|uniref:Uncharacterized protein n=1 Tax=Strigomonas culicis TaxID=28005 RepID=S9V145_9TRYP|nr:hypothetical protein STCU_01363 [Strigomonas culicis]|eukprot:EPY34739.1 hypothetical protein STCU_01363 [Strigomonas culicis]